MDSMLLNGPELLLAALRGATPVLLVLLGELISQRAGIINLGVEGQMLLGACVGFAVAAMTQNPWLGLLAGALAGLALSMVHGLLVLGIGINQLASGLAVLLLGSGLSAFYGIPYVGQQAPSLHSPFPETFGILARLTPTVWMAILLSLLIGIWLYRTRTGLSWRAVGENPALARLVGLPVRRIQLAGILIGGLLSGLGGAALSVDYTHGWVEGMTAGRGLVAVGLVIVARWNPWLALPVALLFGGPEALALRMQAAGIPVSAYLLAMLPYVMTLIVLLLSYWRMRQEAGGMPGGLRAVFSGAQ